jgi:death on curing protein
LDDKRPEPTWVGEDVVRAIHLRQVAEHGGPPGIRDENLLRSALARPQNLFAYGDPPPDLAALAAAYAFGIARNHAFVDGNKRVSLVVCRTFLIINGCDMSATQEEKYLTWWRLAAGEIEEAELAAWIRERSSGRSGERCAVDPP